MQSTYFAAKAIEDHKFDAARTCAPKRRVRTQKTEKAREAWSVLATRPVVNPS